MVERGDDGRMVLPCALGRYRLLHQVGQGGAAAVYVASMTGKGGFERTVAVKVLHRHLTSDPSFVTMFLDEARLCAGIRHPNVVDVYDVDAISGELIIVMEYVEGLALNKLLAKGAPALPIPLGLRINHDALRGLHAAHELKAADGGLVGLIHRDMTPHNVLVGVDGVVRLADFGIAKARGRITNTDSTGIVKGKLRYLAPEQLNPESPADRRLDVFAAGIVL